MQMMLSLPRNDLERLTQVKKGWNSQWDPGRLWFTSFQEQEGEFSLVGGGRTNDDVAEFLQRMSTSVYFDKVKLGPVEKQGGTQFEFVTFELSGIISYSLGAAAEPAPKGG
jgi:Tfp pilus assembly protein PilN